MIEEHFVSATQDIQALLPAVCCGEPMLWTLFVAYMFMHNKIMPIFVLYIRNAMKRFLIIAVLKQVEESQVSESAGTIYFNGPAGKYTITNK